MNNIRQFRERKNLSQKELAVLIGVSPHTIFRWEKQTRQPKLPDLIHLAHVFACSISDLVQLQDDSNPQEPAREA